MKLYNANPTEIILTCKCNIIEVFEDIVAIGEMYSANNLFHCVKIILKRKLAGKLYTYLCMK